MARGSAYPINVAQLPIYANADDAKNKTGVVSYATPTGSSAVGNGRFFSDTDMSTYAPAFALWFTYASHTDSQAFIIGWANDTENGSPNDTENGSPWVSVGSSSNVPLRGELYFGNSSNVPVKAKEVYVGNSSNKPVKGVY